MRTGTANLPLHGGKAPAWLFQRMKKLARYMCLYIVEEMGSEELLRKLSDPFWFQAFGCVLGFDWHSSGVTTTACGAIKEGLKGTEKDTGIFCAGGKGKAGLKTLQEIDAAADRFSLSFGSELIQASRMSAKVDSSGVQDGYSIYHHTFLYTRDGAWSVIQQGMNPDNCYARRYHWLSENVRDFVNEPHTGIQRSAPGDEYVLNLVARESEDNRDTAAGLVRDDINGLVRDLKKLPELSLPSRHMVTTKDINVKYYLKVMETVRDARPETYSELMQVPGVGAATLRAISLVSELIYGQPASTRDPATFSYAHGGKDGTPFPVERKTYDNTIEVMRLAVEKSKVEHSEKQKAVKRLIRHCSQFAPGDGGE